MTRKSTYIITSILLVLTIFYQHASAYSTDVHKRLTATAIDSNAARLNEVLINVGIQGGIIETVDDKWVRVWLEEGSVKEDYTVDIVTSHFYNPLTDKGVSPSQSAYERASELWGFARGELYRGLTTPAATDSERKAREKILAGVFETVGRILHLIQDMAVPAHTREDLHMAEDI